MNDTPTNTGSDGPKVAEVCELRWDDTEPTVEVVGRAVVAPNLLDPEAIEFRDCAPGIEEFLRGFAVWSPERGGPVEWSDGAVWLRALPANLRGSRLLARHP